MGRFSFLGIPILPLWAESLAIPEISKFRFMFLSICSKRLYLRGYECAHRIHKTSGSNDCVARFYRKGGYKGCIRKHDAERGFYKPDQGSLESSTDVIVAPGVILVVYEDSRYRGCSQTISNCYSNSNENRALRKGCVYNDVDSYKVYLC